MEENILRAMVLAGRDLGRIMCQNMAVSCADLRRRSQSCSVDCDLVGHGALIYHSWSCHAGNNVQCRWGRRWRWGRGRRTDELPFTVFRCSGIWCRVHKPMVRQRPTKTEAPDRYQAMQLLSRDAFWQDHRRGQVLLSIQSTESSATQR